MVRLPHKSTAVGLILAVSFLPGFAFGQFDRRQRNAPELVVEANGRMGACDVLMFGADGKHLFAAGDDKVVNIWKFAGQGLEPEKVLRWKTWRERRGAIYAIALAPDSAPAPNNRLVAVAGLGVRTGSISVIDRTTGDVRYGLTEVEQDALALIDQTVWSLAMSPDATQVAIGSADGHVWLWNLASARKNDVKKLGRHGGEQSAPSRTNAAEGNRVRLVSFLDEARVLSVATDGTAVQWDTGRPGTAMHQICFQKLPNVITAALSADQQWLAAAGDGRTGKESRIVEIRSVDGNQAKSITWGGKGRYPNRIAFDADGKRLAVAMFMIPPDAAFSKEVDGEVAIYDLTQAQPQVALRFTTALTPEGVAFHPDGIHLALATNRDYEVSLWDIRGEQAKRVDCQGGHGACLWGVGVSQDGRYLGFQDQPAANPPHPNQRGSGSWRVFDLQKRDWVKEVFNKNTHEWVLEVPFQPVMPLTDEGGWSVEFDRRDAQIWYVVGPDQHKYRLPLNPDTEERPRCFTFLRAESGKLVRLAVGHYWGASLYDLTDRGPKRTRIFIGHQGEVMAIAPSGDQRMLFTASRDQTVNAWSLAEWQFDPELGAQFGERDNKVVVAAVDAGSPAWEAGLTANDEVAFFRVGSYLKPEFDYDRRDPAKPLAAVEQCLDQLRRPVPGKSFYFEIRRPNQAKLIQLVTTVRQRPLWRFFPTRDREWVLWRWQDFFYDTSTNGDFFIGWQMCGDVDQTPVFHRAEQFRAKFHRPDIIGRTLAAKRWIKSDPRIDKVVLSEEEPPEVKLAADSGQVKDNDVKVKLVITQRGQLPEQQPDRVILWINDFRFREWRAVDLQTWRQPKPGVYEAEVTIRADEFRSVPDNRLILQCYNKARLRSTKGEATVRCTRQVSPRLFGLALGVGDSSHTKLPSPKRFEDVKQCVADARRIKKTWQERGRTAYDVALFDCLCDAQVTPEAVLKKIRDIGSQARPDDVFVLFLAGHGFADGILKRPTAAKPGTFTFVCYNFDSSRPDETGLTSQALYEAMADLPCRKLVLINACHAGAAVADDEWVYSDPVRDLTRDGIGPIVIAACEPKQEALVIDVAGDIYEGGLFTQATIRALGSEFSKADADGNGVLDTREMAAYIQKRVQELAREYDKQQNPTATPLEKERFTLAKKPE